VTYARNGLDADVCAAGARPDTTTNTPAANHAFTFSSIRYRCPLSAIRFPLSACRLPLAAIRYPLAAIRLPMAVSTSGLLLDAESCELKAEG
jgi:hypothetical protein